MKEEEIEHRNVQVDEKVSKQFARGVDFNLK
jgi:hypothetical protein